MQTVLEVLSKGSEWLATKGVAQARLQAEWLLAAALGCKRLDLYLRFEEPLTEPTLAQLRAWMKRRSQGEPLQYITGWTDFHGLRLSTDRRALIPRPETEELVERIIQRLQDRPPQRILDLGTGTGAIALALATAVPVASVVATDASPSALDLARENAQALSLTARVEFVQSDWFAKVSGQFDCIVSNPPYLTENEWETAEREVRDHEPHEALVAADEGMAALKAILESALNHASPGALLALETGIAQHDALQQFAMDAGFSSRASERDVSGRPRYIFAEAPV